MWDFEALWKGDLARVGNEGGVPEPDRLAAALDRVAEAKVAERWRLFGAECDERRRRLWAASEAKTHGPGGVALLARVTGLSEETVRRGLVEVESGERLERGQVRRSGGGRRRVIETDPSVVEDLDRLIDPATRGDPESPLRWTSKLSLRASGSCARRWSGWDMRSPSGRSGSF